MSYDPISFAKKILRKGSMLWPPRTAAIKKAYRGINKYECAHCNQLFQRKQVEVNHINAVMPVNKKQISMDEYVLNLYCEVDGFNILCKTCHKSITKLQSEMRKSYKKSKKK